MRPAARSIHVSLPNRPILRPYVYPLLDLLVRRDGHSLHPEYRDAQLGVLLDVQAPLGSIGRLHEQILYALVVYLYHAQRDLVLNAVRGVVHSLVDAPEDLLAGTRDDALVPRVARHGVGLARTCLAIGKETGMVTLEGVI